MSFVLRSWCVSISAVAAVLLVFSFPGDAAAVQLEFEIENVGAGQGDPALTMRTLTPLRDVRVVLVRSDGHERTEPVGDLSSRQTVTFELDPPPGASSYETKIHATNTKGQEVTVDYDFEVTVTGELDIDLLRDQIDFDTGQVPIRINQPVDRIDIEVDDSDGRPAVRDQQSFDGQRGRLNVDWEPAGDVGSVRLTIHYGDGAWYEYVIEPYWVEIPQQIINFETGSATIDDGEASKLKTTRDRIRDALDDAGEHRPNMQLYVAGYTDTVGDAAQNLRLSQRRARALARWFRDHGIDLPIYYQGFGQQALAVDTPDETEERRNRRAVYILGNAPPQTSEKLPGSDWTPLQ